MNTLICAIAVSNQQSYFKLRTKLNSFCLGFVVLGAMCFSSLAHSACSLSAIPITSLPYTVLSSNSAYCLPASLTFASLVAGTPAITVSAGVNNIVIDFNGSTLTLQNGDEVGIQLEGNASAVVSNVTIQNGTIQFPSATPSTNTKNNAINLTDPANVTNAAFNNVILQNMIIANTRGGVESINPADSASNLQVINSQFNNIRTSAIFFPVINGLTVLNSSFSRPTPLPTGGTAINCRAATNVLVKNSNFSNEQQGISIATGGPGSPGIGAPSSGLVVTGCTFTNGAFADINLRGMSNAKITYDTFNDINGNNATIGFASDPNVGGNVASGLLIDHITVISSALSMLPFIPYQATRMVQIGTEFGKTANPQLPIVGAKNVVITNSSFTQTNANLIPEVTVVGPSGPVTTKLLDDALLVFGVDGMLVENNTFNLNANGRLSDCSLPLPYPKSAAFVNDTIPDSSAVIHLGSSWGEVNVQNAIIAFNTITGGSQIGIYSQTGGLATPNNNILIAFNNITATEQGILLDNTTSSLLLGNTVKGVAGTICATGTGIQLDGSLVYNLSAASSSNAISINLVTKNQVGIHVLQGALNNSLHGNLVFSNSIAQILNDNH